MNRGKIALKNSGVGFIAKVVSILLQFVTRNFFIKYLGVDMLGLSSTFSSLLNALSVAELGFQTAVIYNLYKPLADKDYETINKVVNIYKLVYRAIGIFFILASICCLPLLPYIITGIEITNYIRCIFLVQAASSACTYFLAYKRSILYADQYGYISNFVDMLVNIVANIIQIIIIIWLKNYILYLIVKLIQIYIGNIIVHIICTKRYPYLHDERIDFNIFKRIVLQVKDVFTGKIAGYIYSSTDSLVISIFVSTVQVGYFNNYTMITNNIKVLSNSITTPIAPIIGNLIACKDDKDSKIESFNLYNFVRFLIAGAVVSPVIVLTESFIKFWIGDEYILNQSIVVLLSAELYIHIMHSSCCDYISGSGLFKIDKYISMIGAGTNIVTSIIFVKWIGVPGVLMGTVVSQIIFWLTRSFVVYKYCFEKMGKAYLKYWTKQTIYLLLFCLICFAQEKIYSLINISNSFIKLLMGGIICELVLGVTVMIFCSKWKETRILLCEMKKIVRYK
jgi:O-antigen/teichoic acid export membrane protein